MLSGSRHSAGASLSSWGAMAESETYAHLEHLRILGGAERTSDRDGKYLYLTE